MPIKCYHCGEVILQGLRIYDIIDGVMEFFHIFPKECWYEYKMLKDKNMRKEDVKKIQVDRNWKIGFVG